MKIMRKITISALAVVALSLCSCAQNSNVATNPPKENTTIDRKAFARGADVSWVTQMESEGIKFYDESGAERECMELLKEYDINAIRLRVWVNPADGWNNIDDVLLKARRANALGQRVMIDFHYSDTWADPGHQTPPAAWASMGIDEMCEAIADHTREMMEALKRYDIFPEWVQVGNETRTGMLWPLGKAGDHPDYYARMTTAGYEAVKEVFPQSQVIVHIDQGDNLGRFTYLFDILEAHGGKYDMIGMSIYPTAENWVTAVNNCLSNITTLNERYGKPLMICEVGMEYYEAETCYNMLSTLISSAENSTGGACKGVFYWEPQAPAGYNGGYNKGCFEGGRPTKALYAFRETK